MILFRSTSSFSSSGPYSCPRHSYGSLFHTVLVLFAALNSTSALPSSSPSSFALLTSLPVFLFPFPPPHLLSLPPTGNLDYLPFNASHFKVLVSLIYLFYCVCSTIILLNLLIALMGDSYDKVQENALAQGRYEQVDRKGEREGKLEGRGKEEGVVTHSRFQVYFLMLLHPIPLLS